MQPIAYYVCWKPGDPLFYTPSNYRKEVCLETALVIGLYDTPQPNSSTTPCVYFGRYFVQPKYTLDGQCPDGFIKLYTGQVINLPEPWVVD